MADHPYMMLGFGYVAAQVAKLLGLDKLKVIARREEVVNILVGKGVDAKRADLDGDRVALPDMTALSILYTVPPPSNGQEDTRIRLFLDALAVMGRPERIVLISTTGVYGDCQGEWVNEQRSLNPQVDRARRRADAEQQLRGWCEAHDVAFVILRVPGIYGPGKLPEQRIRSGKPVLCPENSPWSNRVHVHDLARACVAALQGGEAVDNQVFNISDNQPSTMTDYFYQVADHLGLARPPCIDIEQARSEMSEGILGYLAESKRIDNTRMRTVLGIEPEYPDLASGLPPACGKS
jgi:nucleoside-diphosphate-sugar epimerase